MPFPEKTYLTRTVRRLIMVGFIISFFILAPLVVLYTMGYRFDVTLRSLKTTGVLNIDAEPKNSTVIINNIALRDKMPIKLFNRAPGTYTVEITADGYYPWKKDIRIESNQTTYIKGLHLFTAATPSILTEQHSEKKIAHIFFSPNKSDSGVFIAHTDDMAEVGVIHTSGVEMYTLTTTTIDATIDVTWAENGTDFAVEITEHKETRLFSGSTQSNKISADMITPTSTPLSYQWTETLLGGTSLFVGTSTLSTRINNGTLTALLHTSTTPIWYTDNGTNIWTYTSSTRTLSRNEDLVISNIEADSILFATENTALLKQNNQHTFVSRSVDGTQYTTALPGPYHLYIPQTKEWVLYSPYEISLLYADGTYNTIYRTDEPIISVLTLEDTGVILIVKKNQLIGFNPGFYTSQVLLQTDMIDSAGVNQDTRTIYFYGTYTDTPGLYSLAY